MDSRVSRNQNPPFSVVDMATSENKPVKSAPENKIVKLAAVKKVKSTPINLFGLLKDDLDASALVEEAVKAIKEEKELEEQERRRKEWEEKQKQLRQEYGGNQGNYGSGSNYYSGRSYDQGSNGYRRGGGGGGGYANQENSGSGNGSSHRGQKGGWNGERNGRKDGRNNRSTEVSNVSPGHEAQQDGDGWTVQGKKGATKVMVWMAKSGMESNVSEENAQSDAQPKCVKGENKVDDAPPEGENKVAVVEKEDAGGDSAEPTNSDNKSNVAEGDSVVDATDAQQYSKDSKKKKSKNGKYEIEERPQLTEEQKEALRKRMTLKEYEKLQAKQLSDSLKRPEERKVTIDKDFESMQLLARKKTEDSPFIKQYSEKGTLKKKDKSLTKEEAAPKTSMSITEFLKPAQHKSNYGPRRSNEQSFGARDGRWSNGGDRTYNDRQRSNGADRFDGKLLNGGDQRYNKIGQLNGERTNGGSQYEGVRPNNGRKPNVETRKVGEGNVANVRGEKKRPDGVCQENSVASKSGNRAADTSAPPEPFRPPSPPPPKVDDANQFPVLSRDARS